MDSITLSTHEPLLNGLRIMMEEAVGVNEYIQPFVELEVALLIIEVAKRAPDPSERARTWARSGPGRRRLGV